MEMSGCRPSRGRISTPTPSHPRTYAVGGRTSPVTCWTSRDEGSPRVATRRTMPSRMLASIHRLAAGFHKECRTRCIPLRGIALRAPSSPASRTRGRRPSGRLERDRRSRSPGPLVRAGGSAARPRATVFDRGVHRRRCARRTMRPGVTRSRSRTARGRPAVGSPRGRWARRPTSASDPLAAATGTSGTSRSTSAPTRRERRTPGCTPRSRGSRRRTDPSARLPPGSRAGNRDYAALIPLIWSHVNPYGKFELDMTARLALL